MPNHLPALCFEIDCRIPKEYFRAIGWGESSVGIETGSYDAALHMAGIENYNVMSGSQIVHSMPSACDSTN
ncbi:MAG: pyruvoyl-dependent arginine decarboxylase [Candidatus Acidiferrales bacterium]